MFQIFEPSHLLHAQITVYYNLGRIFEPILCFIINKTQLHVAIRILIHDCPRIVERLARFYQKLIQILQPCCHVIGIESNIIDFIRRFRETEHTSITPYCSVRCSIFHNHPFHLDICRILCQILRHLCPKSDTVSSISRFYHPISLFPVIYSRSHNHRITVYLGIVIIPLILKTGHKHRRNKDCKYKYIYSFHVLLFLVY